MHVNVVHCGSAPWGRDREIVRDDARCMHVNECALTTVEVTCDVVQSAVASIYNINNALYRCINRRAVASSIETSAVRSSLFLPQT